MVWTYEDPHRIQSVLFFCSLTSIQCFQVTALSSPTLASQKRRKNPDESNYLHLLHPPPWHCPFSLQHHPPLQQSQKQMLLFTTDPMRCKSFEKVPCISRQYTSFFPIVLEVLKMFFLKVRWGFVFFLADRGFYLELSGGYHFPPVLFRLLNNELWR